MAQIASAPGATDRAVPVGTATEGARTKAAGRRARLRRSRVFKPFGALATGGVLSEGTFITGARARIAKGKTGTLYAIFDADRCVAVNPSDTAPLR